MIYRKYKYWKYQTQNEDKKKMHLCLKGDKSKASTTGQSTRNSKKELKHIEEKPL